MSKTTSVSSSYTSDIKANGTTVSGDEVYAPNDIIVYRIKVNGTDVIHKFTRTIVRAYSNLTFTITVRFTARTSTSCGFTDYDFDSPIYADVKVTDNGSSGFTSLTADSVYVQFFCPQGDTNTGGANYYQNTLTNQSFTIGQQKTLTFSYFNDKAIVYERSSPSQDMFYYVAFNITDPDGAHMYVVYSSPDIDRQDLTSYRRTDTVNRVVNGQVLSDTTVQEY